MQAASLVDALPHLEFLGWDRPVLHSIVERLQNEFLRAQDWDLRGLVIVLPSSGARRRLSELLALAAQRAGGVLYPPQIVTVGGLPEKLYVAKFPFASDLVQNLAWVHALQHAPTDQLRQLVPTPPPQSASAQWLELGKMLSGVHRELASDRLDFKSVAGQLGQGHPEWPRWSALADVQELYLQELDRLALWDIQTARLCALKFNEATTDKRLIVAACVDLNQTQRGFLEAVRARAEIWVAAPESHAHLFDGTGCLISDAWRDQILDLPADALLVGNSPTDQAELTAACLAELGAQAHIREVSLGVPDGSLVSELKRHLDLCGVQARFGAGTQLIHSEPVKLLSAIGGYVASRSYDDFATLIRQPAVENLLKSKVRSLPKSWLARVDSYRQEACPKRIDKPIKKESENAKVFGSVAAAITKWLSILPTQAQTVSTLVDPLLEVMSEVYEKFLCNLDDPTEGQLYQAASQVTAAIGSLRDIPAELEPTMTIGEALDWLIGNMSGSLVPAPNDPESVEMLGWLELLLDDAPYLIVSGIHDGVVPESLNADMFLPNTLRRSLGMMDNSRRFARDMYASQVMLHSRKSVRFVVGKADAKGDPLVPSRLLMACPLVDLPDRILHLVQEDRVDVLPAVKLRTRQIEGASGLHVPQPEAVELPKHITVTAFRDYLACPYRFYLRHVLRLYSQDDEQSELDAAQFGNLLHDTLAELGLSEVRHSHDPDAVENFLVGHLRELASKRFGKSPPAAVLIQIEQAEMRLAAFAKHQAERAADGWEIHHTEKGVTFDDDVRVGKHKELVLIGRIDRIDYHPKTMQWAIWDYKTGDTAKTPLSVHLNRSKEWRDLQLPMYLPIAKKLKVTGSPTLGYISLPKREGDTAFTLADFTPDHLTAAAALADDIASKVAVGEFWPMSPDGVTYDDYARICQMQSQRVSVTRPTRGLRRHLSASHARIPEKTVIEAEVILSAGKCSHPRLTPMLIRASAGTGKTFQLSNRLLQIILSGQDIDQILATTFTRKAAGEIMHRLLQRLAMGCVDPKSQSELAEHVPGVDTSSAACLAALRTVTASIHRLRVSTLDSFFAQVARTFSLEMGLPTGWSPMDPAMEPGYQLQAIGELVDRHERKSLMTLVRMLAKGESSRQVSEEIGRTVADGYDVFRITRAKDWDQLPIPKACSEAALESALMTLKQCKMGNKSADEQIEKLHLSASTGNWEAVVTHGIYTNIHELEPSYYRRPMPTDLITALKSLLDRAAAELLPIRRDQTLASHQVLEAFDTQYNALISHNRQLAFSDVTCFLSKWMSSNSHTSQRSQKRTSAATPLVNSPKVQKLDFRLDCGVRHLLLDEFQDTSPEQWRILKPLAQPLGGAPQANQAARQSEHRTANNRALEPVESDDKRGQSAGSFFCVGDTKQAIYGWRGGVAEIFDSVNAAIAGLTQEELRTSFRSSGEVMDAVNGVFQHLPDHANFGGCDSVASTWSQSFPEHVTSRKDLKGYVKLQNGPIAKDSSSSEEAKFEFLEYTAQQIAELVSHSSASVGVLFRTNADVGRMIATLRELGVPASQDGGNPLTDSAAVELVLSLVHLADHPGDSTAAFHVRCSPLSDYLAQYNVRSSSAVSHWFRGQVSRRGLAIAIESISDYLSEHLNWWDQHRLEQLIRCARQFDQQGGGRLLRFEQAVMRDRIALPSEAQVKVMTIHKSKGLEFDAVFLPDLDTDMSAQEPLLILRGTDPVEPPTGVLRYMGNQLQSLLPTNWQEAFEQHRLRGMTESLCMLYVAMTRARLALIMSAKPRTGKPTCRYGSVLQSTLAGSGPLKVSGATLFETGDPEWFRQCPGDRSLPSKISSKRASQEAADLDRDITLDDSLDLTADHGPARSIRLKTNIDQGPVRGLRVAAPSSLQRTSKPQRLGRVFSVSTSIGATYGSLIHAFFEHVEWLEDFRLDKSELRRIAMAAVEPEALRHLSQSQVIEDFAKFLELSSVQAALSRKRYEPGDFGFTPERIEIDNERPISLIMGDRLVSGTIDRLVVLYQNGKPFAAEIIDYKTDAFDQSIPLVWLEDRVEHHRPQLEVYAEVVSKLFDLPPSRIATYLIMLSGNNLHRVT